LAEREAILLCHQVRTISKKRIGRRIGRLSVQKRQEVLGALCRRFES